MKQNFLMIIFSVLISSVASAQIKFNSITNEAVANSNLSYQFELVDENTSQPINEKNLVETHTKILHFIVYDASLNEFNHVHPNFTGTEWSVELNLPVNGNYTLWAQGETADGTEFSVSRNLIIYNGAPEWPVMNLVDNRVGIDGNTKLELTSKNIKAGQMVMLDFNVSHIDGSLPNMSPYLGAFAHVIAIKLGGNELIHVHPMEGKFLNSGILHSVFPESGEYRLWIQFIDNGELKTFSLSVDVN